MGLSTKSNLKRETRNVKLTKTIISQIGILCLVSMITLLTLVSCGGGGSDDLGAPQTAAVNNELVPITFNGSQGIESTVTRASGTPLSEKAQQFHVWGYKNMPTPQKVFPCYQVNWVANTAYTTTSNTNNWEYVGISDQTIKYWDWGAQAYRFFAATKWKEASIPADIASYEENRSYGDNGTVSMKVDASPVLDDGGKYKKDATDAKLALAPYFSRLWYSTGNPTNYPDKQFGKPVTLEFLKPYARVRFIYNYVYPREGITLSDQSFKPTDGSKIARKGIVTVHYPTDNTKDKEWYTVGAQTGEGSGELTAFTEDFDPDNDTKIYSTCDKGWYTVIPNLTQDSYTLSVTVSGQNKTAVVPAEYMKWLPGYSYTYIFKITDKGGIEIGWVDYKVTPWTDMEVSKSVYNW